MFRRLADIVDRALSFFVIRMIAYALATLIVTAALTALAVWAASVIATEQVMK